MGKRLSHTPSSKIKNDIRRLWLRSRERAAAIKREKNTCQSCGKKGSVAKGKEVKIEVHHVKGITNWNDVVQYIRENILVDPKELEVLCKDCHKEITNK